MDTSNFTGHLVIVMAPTGSGKGTLIKYIHETVPEVSYKISCTTREPRPGEVDGKDAYFLSRAEFEQKVTDGEFVEWAEYGGNLYGTLISEIKDRLEHGEIVVAELELKGVEQIKKIIPDEFITIVYIDGGDWDVIKERVLKRAPMSEEKLQLRKERYEHECSYKAHADVVVQNGNGMLEQAQKEFERIIKEIISQKANAG